MRVSYLFVFLLNAVLLLGFFYFIQHRQVISEGKYREKLKKSKTSIDFQQREEIANHVAKPVMLASGTVCPKIEKCEKLTCPSCESEKSVEKPWLIIGIPTTPRPMSHDYLTPTLAALAIQIGSDLADPFYSRVKVIVMSHQEYHVVYTRLKAQYASDMRFEFVFKSQTKPANVALGTRPNLRVQQQTLDVVDLLEYSSFKSEYFLFMEDDFEVCSNGIAAIHHLITKANAYHPTWIAARCSFGLNGILYHNNADLKRFSKYLKDHHARRPPDHLVTEFSASETPEATEYVKRRPIIGFRYNLFLHLGKVSTLGNTDWGFPPCHKELVFPVTFEAEAWDPKKCPNDDIWPCDVDEKLKKRYGRVVWQN